MSESSSREWLLARPEVDEDTAAKIAAECFGAFGVLTEIGSQQDRNFSVSDAHSGILLKFDHPSTTNAEREFQAQVIDRLRAGGVATPELFTARAGSDPRIELRHADGTTEMITARAFAWIDGYPLTDIPDWSGVHAEQLGQLAGKSAAALAKLEHPASARNIQWELSRALEVVEQLQQSLPEERRELCVAVAKRADAVVRSLAETLPRQVIHGDLTSDNVLQGADGTLWAVDLGDSAQSWRVAELAVTAADVLGRTQDLSIVCRAVRGFSREVTLSDTELTALWPLIVLRGAVLAVSGWSQLKIDPGNDYARERIEHEWRVFEASLAIDADTAEAHLRVAAGLPHRPCMNYAPLFDGTLASLDLGVRSPLLDRGAWLEVDVEGRLAAQKITEGRQQDAKLAAVFAPFGLPRLSRLSANVDELAETRPRCVEIWTDAGTVLRAPYAGQLTHAGDTVELFDRGIVLRITGVAAVIATGQVQAGQPIAITGGTSLRVTRRVHDVEAEADFVRFDGEYESSGALDPSPILGLSAATDPDLELQLERLRRETAMGGASERYYAHPPQIERGWGAILVETRGRGYLDMVNNVSAIGHSHPKLADSVTRQLNLLNTNSRFLYERYADFTSRLLEHSPDPEIDVVIPVSSGSEANDLAIHLAQVATQRRAIVATREGYHGWTMASDAVSTSAFDNPNAAATRPDWVDIVSAPNPYRGTHRGADAAEAYVTELRAHLQQLEADGNPAAAFICEPVLGNAGGVLPPAGYLREAYAAIHAAGGLAIADEVQVGYGRLGRSFWGVELNDAVPDIITVAKAAGNAFPLGAVLTKRWILDSLKKDGMFFSSAGGAPASMAAGLAVLDVIRDEGLQENALHVGDHLVSRLHELALRHEIIGAVHGSGLYLGVELVRDRAELTPATDETREVCERLLDHGIIMQATSERQNVLKVKPPMTLTLEQADVFIEALDQVLSDVNKSNVAI